MNANTTHVRSGGRDPSVGSHSRTLRRPGSVVSLSVLLALLAIGASQGGVAMLTNPVDPLGLSPSFLEGTPVGDYFWPGVFLACIAAASVLTAVGLVFDWRWQWARPIERAVGFRWPWLGAVSTGSVLLTFEIIELFVVPFHPIMHPLLIAASAAIVLLAVLPSSRRFLQVHREA